MRRTRSSASADQFTIAACLSFACLPPKIGELHGRCVYRSRDCWLSLEYHSRCLNHNTHHGTSLRYVYRDIDITVQYFGTNLAIQISQYKYRDTGITIPGSRYLDRDTGITIQRSWYEYRDRDIAVEILRSRYYDPDITIWRSRYHDPNITIWVSWSHIVIQISWYWQLIVCSRFRPVYHWTFLYNTNKNIEFKNYTWMEPTIWSHPNYNMYRVVVGAFDNRTKLLLNKSSKQPKQTHPNTKTPLFSIRNKNKKW